MPTRISTPLYTESLFYEQPHNGSTPQYGGNISAIDWSVADESDTYGKRGYTFSYDGMSRLTAAGYLENGKLNNHFSTSYKYDIMGNILSLRREGLLDSGDYGTIDDLTYSYEGNQVVKIDDAADESPNYSGAMHFRDAANEETEYTYDANGNMLTDSNKGITSIDYNVLDLPQCINIKPNVLGNSDNKVCYTYSADGTKLRSTYKKGNSQVLPYKPTPSSNIKTNGMVTPTVKTFESNYHYCSNLVYNNDRLSTILFDGGYASVDEGGGIVMHFYVKDHLGSNRLVVDGNGNIEEVNHYYPFGALMGDRCGVSRNKYKYIGKELDTMYGWNMQDHEARWYDPVLGRWMATDPLQEKYSDFSSYIYCMNNPLKLVDTNGMETHVAKNKFGTYTVIGGILNKDRNIYLYSKDRNGKYTIRGASIGISTSTTSFYNSDKQKWADCTIDPHDDSGNKFLTNMITKKPTLFDDYMKNARQKKLYDFKVSNGTVTTADDYKDIYRGMPIGVTGKGQCIYTSARDIGNIAAGYIAGINGMSWRSSRIAFDLYESKTDGKLCIEGITTRNAEYYGWRLGNNIKYTPARKAKILARSIGYGFKALGNYLYNGIIAIF